MINAGFLWAVLLTCIVTLLPITSALGDEQENEYVKYRFVEKVINQYYESNYNKEFQLQLSDYWPPERTENEPLEMTAIRALSALSKGHRNKFLSFYDKADIIQKSITKTQRYAKYFRVMSDKYKGSTVRFIKKIAYGYSDDHRTIIEIKNSETNQSDHFVFLFNGKGWVLTDLWHEDPKSKWIYDALSMRTIN